MFGTGIAVAITGLALLGIGGFFGPDWEQRETGIFAAEGTSQTVSSESGRSPRGPTGAAPVTTE
jgi:hypothetical protein